MKTGDKVKLTQLNTYKETFHTIKSFKVLEGGNVSVTITGRRECIGASQFPPYKRIYIDKRYTLRNGFRLTSYGSNVVYEIEVA